MSRLKDEDGFVGDRANKGAFRDMLEKWRDVMSKGGDDPFGDEDTDAIAKKHLEELLVEGDPEAAGVVQSAIEEFAQELAAVIRRFLKLKAWRDTERLVVGGGFRGGRVGELAVGRAAVLLKADYPRSRADVPFATTPTMRVSLARSIWRRHGYSKATMRFWPPTSAAQTFAPAWWNSTSRAIRHSQRLRSGNASIGATPMKKT